MGLKRYKNVAKVALAPYTGGLSLLGKDDLLGTKPGLETQQMDNWSPEQKALFKSMYGSMQGGMQDYSATSEQTGYLDFMNNYGDWAKQTTGDIYDPSSVSQYYKDSVIPAWQRNIKPQLDEAYAGYSGAGFQSPRAAAIGRSMDTINQQQAADVYGVDKNRQNALFGLMQNQPGMMQGAANYSSMIGTPMNSPYYQAAFNMLGLSPYQNIGAMNPGTEGLGPSIIGAGGRMGAAAIASDRRLKTNIRKIGATDEGTPLYTYNYIWGDPGVGVMSDEAPRKAVLKGVLNGFDAVDYSKIN